MREKNDHRLPYLFITDHTVFRFHRAKQTYLSFFRVPVTTNTTVTTKAFLGMDCIYRKMTTDFKNWPNIMSLYQEHFQYQMPFLVTLSPHR